MEWIRWSGDMFEVLMQWRSAAQRTTTQDLSELQPQPNDLMLVLHRPLEPAVIYKDNPAHQHLLNSIFGR